MRGFAQTAVCPRCGTEKATGGDVAPIVTCLKCGLGFDPRPREVPLPDKPEAEALEVTTTSTLIREESDDTQALLTTGDGFFTGVLYTLTSFFCSALMISASYYFYAPLFLVLTYWGVSRMLNRNYVLVTAGEITTWQRPLPRRRRMTGNVLEVARVIADRDHVLAQELIDTIVRHRERLLISSLPVQTTSSITIDG